MKAVIDHARFGEIVVMRTRRARRISLSVRPPAKVRLTMPLGCPMKDGIAFIAEKEEWIASALAKIADKYPVRTIEPGYRTPTRELRFVPDDTDVIAGRVSGGAITVTHPKSVDYTDAKVQEAARSAIIRALKLEAKEIFPPIVERIAREHGFKYNKVTARTTTSRWGSCSMDNNISLSIFLLCVPRHLCEYVILHELCHTKYKDHSAKYHRLLDSLLDGREKELAQELHTYRTDVI